MAIYNYIVIYSAQLLHFILRFTHPLSEYVLNFIYRLVMGKAKPLPPIENPILLLSAMELAAKIRKKQGKWGLRAKQVNPLLNAIVDDSYDEALKEAKAVDIMLSKTTKSVEEIVAETPLLGIPFTCKEVIGIKGLSQTNGIVKSRDHIADVDCHAAACYRKAGAIPIGVTNVPEISLWWETDNCIRGMTVNPYDNIRTVGGSTGGEGAIITAAGSIMGIGTDIGGSIRLPSAFCGIYGHKPSRGIVSNWGAFPWCHLTPDRRDTRPTKDFVSTGPMCRYATDLPHLLKVLSDNDSRLKLDEKVDFKKVKVYYIKEIPGILQGATRDIKNSIVKAAKHFEETYNTKTIPIFFDELSDAFEIWLSKFTQVEAPTVATYIKNQSGSFHPCLEFLKYILGRSNHTLPLIFSSFAFAPKKDRHYNLCLQKFDDLLKKFETIFEDDSIVLFPTHPEPAPHYLMTLPKIPNVGYTGIFNVLGFPVTAIPGGMTQGVPFGIQAISGQFKDHLTIAAAIELDKVFGGWKSPCPVNV
ncbi:hypothetical protein JTE90_009577 [Oedothorax gibbosus]|uniref:Amidase domain-containing protein n=1 Tax=Oedothorax gibbosus TaxID=931172 RepID=A0AAV6VJY5_9ARAC|nr:hypothetical protein JTE90_009577 [Oedothorax gibbosus]